MARGKFKRGGGGGGRGRGRGRGGGGGGRQQQDNRQSFEQVNKRNDKFERFYNTLNIVPEGPEREAFWAAIRRELPNSFRFTGSKGHALSVRNNLVERFFPVISEIKHEGKPVELPKSMPWYPEGLAYSMTTPKHVVRKYEPFKEFQKFLVSETGVGNISRQEQVSMIPPLVLDIRPEHTVLDLCAAPGSKSAQLIEAIHAGEEERVERAISAARGAESDKNGEHVEEPDFGRATGLLIANDVNYQRAQMLVHQVKRLNSPNLIVMNHDATMFPSIELSTPTVSGQKKARKYLKFDRILADVPCSGDGTCRKNPGIWRDWSPQNGLGLYITQVRILTRTLQMLKVGGRAVYSTCSMNPVEDEAVVASAIERCGGSSKVKIIDCSDRLPGLIRSPGLTDWSIMSRTGSIYESWAEAVQHEADGSKVVPGMFAPEANENIPLQHCMRVYPHQQDTGGFFITVLEKLSEIKAKAENESKSSNKQWTFSEPQEGTQNTDFGELLNDVKSDPMDAQGHLFNSNPDEEALVHNSDPSAAARQNAEDHMTGSKRPADEEAEAAGETTIKKARFGDEPADLTSTTATNRREHYPLPPSVAAAVQASDAQPGSEIIDEEVSTNGGTEIVTEAKHPADDVPFEQSRPETSLQPPRKPRRGDEPANEESFKYLAPEHPELETIYNFYELRSEFPRDRFLVRNPAGDPVKGIYYSSQLAKDILITNEGRGMKFVHAGVKMFMKQDAQGQDICRWRIQTEGLPIIEGWVGEGRVIRLRKKSILRKLLVEMFPHVGRAEDPEAGWRALGEIGEPVLNISMGCCVLRVDVSKDDEEDGFSEALTLPMWRSMHSLNLMLPKEERKAMLLRIFNEDVELVNHSDPQHRKKSRGDDLRDGEAATGSISAQDVAEETERNIAASDDKGVIKNGKLLQSDDVEVDGAMDGLEDEGDVALDDNMKVDALEEKEDENNKIKAAMPERDGEGDDYNTTV